MLPPFVVLILDYFIDYGIGSLFCSVCDVIDADQDLLDLNMDTSSVTSAVPAVSSAVSAIPPTAAAASGKIRRCSCGRKMSSLNYDHHSVCSFCRGFESNVDNRCEECLLITDNQFQLYFKHQKSLKCKVISRQHSRSRLNRMTLLCPPQTILWISLSPSSVVCEDSDGGSSGISPVVERSASVTLDQLHNLLGYFTKS